MELLTSAIVEPVVNVLKNHITQKLRNLTSSADRVKEMKDKMKVLDGQRIDNENHLRRNHADYKEIPARVQEWLEEVKKIKEDVENDGCFVLEKKMRRNSENNREMRDRVPESLEEVEKIKEDADNIPTNNIGCFNIKKKYLAGRNALRHIKDIDRLIKESSEMKWSDADIGFGRVDSKHLASTSGGGTQNLFKSRDKTFNDALKLLQQNDDDDATRVIALCGMGGVGKTTLMKQLKEAAHDNKMFNWISVAVIGNTPDWFKIQKVIAADTGKPLTETDETLMATSLSKRFEEFSKRNERSLVILDDVWERINLKDIGLASPLPKGVKLLLTSRDEKICQQIAVHADSDHKVVRVDVLEEGEARDFFSRISGVEHDHELYQIGCDIVKKCGCLPLAIKLIAADLKGKTKPKWRHTLKRLKNNDLDKNVQEIINISYESLVHDDKEIFLLCGLFPEDSNIPIEDLTRYAWGLKLFDDSSMEDARDSTHASVSNLKDAYLLMNGDSRHSDCVKMHDLVLSFAVATVSKGGEDGCRIIHHEDDFSKRSEADNMSQSCKQLSLTCKGMSEFPSEFRFPNLSLLKLMHGNESLRFPRGFYEVMQKLQVIAFDKLKYPLVPTSFECSAKLRTLCLHKCSLTFDLACIGNLSNLEVLSFANSGITTIPSTFGNLKKLRLLDVTGCWNLVIDDGVLKSLVKLEELYMIPYYKKACCFTDNHSSELAERSENLCALEFEFIGNNAHMKNMSYKKLKRFKLSVGCSFTEVRNVLRTRQVDIHSYENSLKLITNREELELLKSMLNELFKITDALYLQVNDMNTLPYSWFSNLRLLVVSKCAELTYLFTPSVATNLSKLEYLTISRCHSMEAVIRTENNGSSIIMFPNLKYLKLANLQKLLSFSNNANVIELPCLMKLHLEGLPKITSIYPSSASSSVSCNISRLQSFFHKEDATPILEKLVVSDMENLKEIWPPQFSVINLCPLRKLKVKGCGSIEVLFNMDFGEIEQLSSSSLRSIEVDGCSRLVKLFSCNPFPFLNNLQVLNVFRCGSIQVLFNTDLGRAGKSDEQVCSSSLRSIVVEGCDSLVNLLPSNPMPLFNHLEELEVEDCGSIEVIFDIDMGCVGEMDKVSSSRLRSIKLDGLRKLREVWRIKDAGNNLIHGFEAVESIWIEKCERFENLITPATTNLDMRALKDVVIYKCGRESERKNELVEKEKEISKIAFPLPTFNNLHKLILWEYEDVEVVFEITSPISRESPHNTQQQLIILPNLEVLYLYELEKMSHVWKCNWNELILQKPESQSSFHNLTTITMESCNSIKYLFSPLMANLLSSLKEIDISSCDAIEEVISNRDDEDVSINSHTTASVGMVFPRLKSLKLVNLPNFVGFFLGKNEFIWPALEKVVIGECPQITVFTCGQSTAPKLKFINTSLGKHSVECGLNFHVTTTSHQARLPSYESTSSYRPTTMERLPWSYHNLIEANMYEYKTSGGQTLFSSDEVSQLQKLETVHCSSCRDIEEIFDSQTDAEIPNLRQVDLRWLIDLKYIWKSKQGTVLKFPNLTRLSIDRCHSLEYVFTCSMVGSILQLQELNISDCDSMKVIVKGEEESDAIVNAIVEFPCLKSLKLKDLKSLEGFCLGKEAFEFPSLDTLEIGYWCRKMTVFTKGDLFASKLHAISKWDRKYNIQNRLLNSFF